MGLTSTPLRVLTIVLAVLATLGALLLWNRVRGPRPIRWFSRIVLLLSGYAFTAVAVLVTINIAYGGLIANWGDLFADPNAGFRMHGTFKHGHFPGGKFPGGQFPPGGRFPGGPPPGWPGAGNPGGVKPEAGEPGAGDPGGASPGTASPGTASPGAADPGVGGPGAGGQLLAGSPAPAH